MASQTDEKKDQITDFFLLKRVSPENNLYEIFLRCNDFIKFPGMLFSLFRYESGLCSNRPAPDGHFPERSRAS